MTNKKYELIVFDLDGTLLDTSRGIYNSVRFAEKAMNFEPIPDEKLKLFVGPPPKDMYQKVYCVDEVTAAQATVFHRQYSKEKAIFEASPYNGIVNMLTYLKKQGYKLAVATLKGQKIAETILNHYELANFFDAIVGMDANETFTKAKTILEAKRRTNTHGDCLLVGDTVYDLDGAKELDIDFIACTYGFGFCQNDVIDYYRLCGCISDPFALSKLL